MHYIDDDIAGDYDDMISRAQIAIVTEFEKLLDKYARFNAEFPE